MMSICVTVDSKYMRYLFVMLLSLFKNNPNGSITLFVIHPDFTEEDIQEITALTKNYGNRAEFIHEELATYDKMPINDGFHEQFLSPVIWYRLRLAEILPQTVERVLLLDVDIIVNQSVEKLFSMDMGDCLFAMSPNMWFNGRIGDNNKDWYENRNNLTHYNIGVMLWNLKKIRSRFPKEYIFQEAIARKEKIKLPTFDEEVFNVLFGEAEIYPLPAEKWNYISPAEHVFENPNFAVYESNEELLAGCHILHYAGMNPWQAGVKNQSFKIWWQYCKKTPYYVEILEECYWSCEKALEESEKKRQAASEDSEYKLRKMEYLLTDKGQEFLRQKLEEKNLKKIFVYGAGRIAQCIHVALQNTNIEIIGYLDREKQGIFCKKSIHGLEEASALPMDAILVSNGRLFSDVFRDLSEQGVTCPILSIDRL